MMEVQLDHRTARGRRNRNEDFVGAAIPDGEVLHNKGVLLAIADGVGGHARGQEASEYAVRSLLADYYATPDTWSVEKSLSTVLLAVNRWLLGEARKKRELAGMATTLTALVLRGRRFHVAHVGDSRAYLIRGADCSQLTEDHTWDHPELRNVLRRAVGLDEHLQIDHRDGSVEEGDRFVLLTDGVWGSLDADSIAAQVRDAVRPSISAQGLVASAELHGARDNCTVLVAHVDSLGEASLRDQLLSTQRLPVPRRLHAGDRIDGLHIRQVIHASRVTLLYRVEREGPDGCEPLVLKTLREEASDEEAVGALIYEEWLARRTLGQGFPEVCSHRSRTHLYYLMRWYDGETLRTRQERGHRFDPAEVVRIGLPLLRGIASLHRLGIIHRDIKPDNLHLGSDGQLRILDLGVAASDSDQFREINNPGTPSYMAPELFSGGRADEVTDLYACAVTLYALLTRHYPYGEVEPFQHPHFGQPVPPTRYRPETPAWLENLLLKGVALLPTDRFETAEEFLLALERGAHRALGVPARVPLVKRNPRLAVKLIAITSLLINFVMLFLLSRHR